MNRSNPVSVRLDKDLEISLKDWMAQHPSINFSTIANMAIREFISHEHVLKPVEIASSVEVEKSVQKMVKKHKDMLKKLK